FLTILTGFDIKMLIERKVSFTNFRYRLMRFLSGRYGTDSLFYAIFICAVFLAAVNIFVRSVVLQILVYIIMGYGLFRVLSRNLSVRAEENRKFTEFLNRFKKQGEKLRRRRADKCHIYKKCRRCKAVLRLPRRPGKHKTVCPKCGNEFTVRVIKKY
ncbi:MAG: hypothetical protein II802_03870, partial [Clostridia bacterium]|nr:hypothetical protein [Clostridia bacterium]